jgi:hypothetical protein
MINNEINPTSPTTSKENADKTAIALEHAHFSGPIPPPAILEKYNQLIPGAAERILVMAEKDAAHVQEMNKLIIEVSSKESKRGQLFGLFVALAAMSMTALALLLGHETAASIIGGSTVVGLVSVFVTGHSQQTKR